MSTPSFRSVAFCFLFLLSVASPLRAAEPLRPIRAAKPPLIDGVLDDAVWREAPSVTGFRTFIPDFGKAMPDDTIAYYAYDDANLYFAFRAFERDPSQIKASIASRDTIRSDDFVCINLDSFNDQQSLYAFYVNPLGIQMDSRFAAGQEDFGFDAVWQSAGQIDDRGYTIEMRIPFKSIRYRGSERVTMGLFFERYLSRRNEHGSWPELDPKAGMNFLIEMYPIEFRDIRRYTLLEVLPDVTYARHQVAQAGALATASSGADLGVTGRYGLTAQLTADAAWNPDFSQVEADAGQVDINLRSPLFFAEKRPFFLEGREVFNLGGPSQGGPLQSVVHTRTIADPRAGVKVSGKLAARDTLASIYAADRQPADGPGEQPLAHVTAVRYKRSLHQDSYLGGIYAGREQAGGFNRVAGGDGSMRLSQAASVGFYALASATRAAGQESDGHALGAEYSRSTRRLEMSLSGLDISRNFNVETGYLLRNGLSSLGATIAPRFYPKSRLVRRIVVALNTEQTRDAFSGIWESSNLLTTQFTLRGATSLTARCGPSTEVFDGRRFSTSACNASASSQITKRLSAQVSLSRGNAIYYSADPFGGRATRGSMSIVYQPSEQWSQTLSITYASFHRPAGGGRVYDYGIFRSRTAFQLNRLLLFRGVLEYNSFRRQLLTDFLASFTYIPGTVVHAGYGSLYEKTHWDGERYVRGRSLAESRRGLFFKASYLWRL